MVWLCTAPGHQWGTELNKRATLAWVTGSLVCSWANLSWAAPERDADPSPVASITFPATVAREHLISGVRWQGLPVHVEILDIAKPLDAFLEELAGLIPAASVLHGQGSMMVAHWTKDGTSFLMNMESRGEHQTRAIVSTVSLVPSIPATSTPSTTSTTHEAGKCGFFTIRGDRFVTSQRSPMFEMNDVSSVERADVTAHSVSLPAASVASHVVQSLRRHGWTVSRHDVAPTGEQGPWFTLEAACGRQRARVDVWPHLGQTRVLSYQSGDRS